MFKFEYIVILLSIISLNVYCSNTNKKCIRESSCLCVKNEYSKLDISSILGGRSSLEDTQGNFTYYFLGCEDKDFTCGNNKTHASLLKYNKTSNECLQIGKASSIKFEFTDDNHKDYQLIYNETGNATGVYPTIRLICDDFEIPFIKVINVENNELVLSSPKACFITKSRGLSGGSIFLLILFVTAGVYFFGGGLLLYCIRGARGIEVVPNLEFWKGLPGLVKDGAIFLFSGCKPNSIVTAETYDRI